MCSGFMTAPSVATTQQKSIAHIRKSDQKECGRFLGTCTDRTLVKTNNRATLQTFEELNSMPRPDARRVHLRAPCWKLRMFEESTVTKRGHSEEHSKQKSKQVISNPDLSSLADRQSRQACKLVARAQWARAGSIFKGVEACCSVRFTWRSASQGNDLSTGCTG